MDYEIAEQTDSLTRVTLQGRLDAAGVDRVEASISAALQKGGNAIFDLDQVEFLSSLGIRFFIRVAKMLDRRDCKLVLVAPRPLVDDALKHSSIDDIIPVAPDVDAALSQLAS